MKIVNRKPILFSSLALAAVVAGRVLSASGAGDPLPVPAPQVVQDGITVTSTAGPVATWARGLEQPVEAGVTVGSVAPVIIAGGELRRPW